jgi:hypothetical protein
MAELMALISCWYRFILSNAEVSDRSHPSLTFGLSQAEPAGPGSLHRLVGLFRLLP